MSVRVYIGWDPRTAAAFEVCRHSLIRHASVPVDAIGLCDRALRAGGAYWRPYRVDERGQMWDARDGAPFSTEFSYTRFCVPALEGYGDEPVVFCDADMLWRGDVDELVALAGDAAVACVKHEHRPGELLKMTGAAQRCYGRKNWSSLMVLRPMRCTALTRYAVNVRPRDWLHGLRWVEDTDIGDLPEQWNWLEGWSDPEIDPKVVHFTRGTPDMAGYEGAAYAGAWRDELRAAIAGGDLQVAAAARQAGHGPGRPKSLGTPVPACGSANGHSAGG